MTNEDNSERDATILEASIYLLGFAQNNGWFYRQRPCGCGIETHTHVDTNTKYCKWCKSLWDNHDPECTLGRAMNTVVLEIDRRLNDAVANQ